MCFPKLNTLYDEIDRQPDGKAFMRRVLEVMNIGWRVSAEDMANIPAEGPAILVANHPYGAVEGVILGDLLSGIRTDFKIMGSLFLRYIPDIHDLIIFVDNFGNTSSARQNIGPLKECMRCLRDGHMLVVFPAGEVSHVNLRQGHVIDPPWSTTVGRLVARTKAPVVPVFFHGRNSDLFQLLGLMHPRLRTVMLSREFHNMQRQTVDISVARPIPYEKLQHLHDDETLTRYLRLRTYILRQRMPQSTGPALPFFFRRSARGHRPSVHAPRAELPIALGPDPEQLAAEVAGLPTTSLLLLHGPFQVYATRAQTIPLALQEIGRLREYTFRQVGEGTGKATDLDRFDEYYEHLFIWNTVEREIVGAYRLGRTDEIIAAHGADGLYTSTLFSYKPSLFRRMHPALEMGRSFVRPEYQKTYAPLLLLWKGIARFLMREPEYTILFGPVSISNEYSPLSKELIVRFLREHNCFSEYARLVKPKTPPRLNTLRRHEIREFRNAFTSMDDVTAAISDIDAEFKGIPVLLRQYLKLGGKILAFNVDHEFQSCLDGLIMVDMLQADPRSLVSFFGKDNLAMYYDYHAVPQPEKLA